MFDFGLKPCPLCGGEAEVARLTQGHDHLDAVIKCTDCGLTLEWENEIKVSISRSGKRTAVKAGLDPIEAWNRRNCEDCEICGYKLHSDRVGNLHDCNDCGRCDCDYMPPPGADTRINCPLWRAMEAAE